MPLMNVRPNGTKENDRALVFCPSWDLMPFCRPQPKAPATLTRPPQWDADDARAIWTGPAAPGSRHALTVTIHEAEAEELLAFLLSPLRRASKERATRQAPRRSDARLARSSNAHAGPGPAWRRRVMFFHTRRSALTSS